MKTTLAVSALLATQATCFMIQPNAQARTTFLNAEYQPIEGESRINHKIDLESEKVANMETMSSGKKVFCRCWLSGTFPLCDGTHVKHNKAIGDNVGPLIVEVKSD